MARPVLVLLAGVVALAVTVEGAPRGTRVRGTPLPTDGGGSNTDAGPAPAWELWATVSTLELSVARRDVSGYSNGSVAVFPGGCVTTGTDPNTQYICDDASDVIDVVAFDGSAQVLKLGEARGWVASCGAGNTVVMAGGGQSGVLPHSARADILDLSTLTVTTNATALRVPRWGLSCTNIGSRVYFPGGKATIKGYKESYGTPLIDVYDTAAKTWSVTPHNLTWARESASALNVSGHLVVAGGVRKLNNGPYSGDNSIDWFQSPDTAGAYYNLLTMDSTVYDVGAASLGGNGYFVSNKYLYIVSDAGDLDKVALPADMKALGGGVVPSAHLPQNGVGIMPMVCFYGQPATLFCYHIVQSQWTSFKCSTPHQSGAIVVVGESVWVAGGFDQTSSHTVPTAVIDVFDFHGSL